MRCQNCAFREVDFLTTYNGRGLIEFSYCNQDVARAKMVDPDIERECDNYIEKTEILEEVEDAS